MLKTTSIAITLIFILAVSVSADNGKPADIDSKSWTDMSLQKTKTFYTIDDERYLYSYAWNRSVKADGPGQTDWSSRVNGLPWAFNWCCRRDPAFLISGDLPRVALARRYRIPSLSPPIISLGDLRIRCTVNGRSYLLDEADDIHTLFHPWGTEHTVKLNTTVPLIFNIRSMLVDNYGMAVSVSVRAESDQPVDADIELIYGGVADKGNAQQVTTYIVSSPKDTEKNVLAPIPGGVAISSPGIQSGVAVVADKADVTIASPDSGDITGNRAIFLYKMKLSRDAGVIRLIAYETNPDVKERLTLDRFDEYCESSEAYYSRLIAPYEISTPDPVLDAAFYTALVNFDYEYASPAWLEGVHCWSAPLANNYQISAAISLGQTVRARDALLFYADAPDGPCPGRNADGSQVISGSFNFEEGIPYFIEQLYRYWQATGDNSTVDRIWNPLVKNFEKYWTVRDPEGNMLLSYHESSNCFLYQADHLSLPGDSFSPSIIMTDCLEKMADIAESRSEPGLAAGWRHRAEYMRSEIIRKLWSLGQGKFIGVLDYQGYPMQANYYTDFVFPQLYSKLPVEYNWISLKTLDRTLWVGDHLMRVGNMKPSLFGNDNIMPVQMSEAAEAYCRAGRSDEGYRLLHGTAFSATTYTDSPGSFPERMSDSGFGLSDYVFGNPTGAFIHGLTAGLFGIERRSAGQAMEWHPAIPDEWKSARIKLDDIAVSVTGMHGDRIYSISMPQIQELDLQIPLHGHRVISVSDDGGKSLNYKIAAHPGGNFLQIKLNGSNKYKIHIVSKNQDDNIKIFSGLKAGRKIDIKLPEFGMSITDPQKAFVDFKIDGDRLTGRLAKSDNPRIFFLNAEKSGNIIPVDVSPESAVNAGNSISHLSGKREHLVMDTLFNSETIQSRNMWRFAPISLDMTKAVKDENMLQIGEYSFGVKPSGMNILLAEVGDLDSYTNALKLSGKPHSVRLNVGKSVKGIELLMVSEWRVRLTGMRVGEFVLHYSDGSEQSIPIVNGRNTGSLNSRQADGVIFHELEWLKNIYILPLNGDPDRKLDYVDAIVLVPDGSLGILAANLVL